MARVRALPGRLMRGGRVRVLLPLIVWAGLVWTIGGLHDLPGNDEILQRWDKVGHFGMYGVLGFLCGRAWWQIRGGVAAVVLIAFGLALGGADEWRQVGIAERSGSAADWLADTAGVLGGFLLVALYARPRQRT
jgi:VanZ family protein